MQGTWAQYLQEKKERVANYEDDIESGAVVDESLALLTMIDMKPLVFSKAEGYLGLIISARVESPLNLYKSLRIALS